MKLSFSIRLFFSMAALSLGAALVSSCTSGGSGGGLADTGYGPFDSRGNYVEDWADNPSKWKRRPTSQDALPDTEPALLASNDSPPSSMTPISTSSTSSGPVEVARLKPTTTTTSTSQARTSTTAKPKTTTTTAKTTVKPKPKTVATKPRTSPSTRVVVKKGDTLSGLATRYKSSVTAIQKANGMRDTKLAIGRSLVIPRK